MGKCTTCDKGLPVLIKEICKKDMNKHKITINIIILVIKEMGKKKTPKDRIVHLASKDLKVTKSQAHTGETGPLGLFVWMYKLVGH